MFPSQNDSYGSKHVKVLNGVNKNHYVMLCYDGFLNVTEYIAAHWCGN